MTFPAQFTLEQLEEAERFTQNFDKHRAEAYARHGNKMMNSAVKKAEQFLTENSQTLSVSHNVWLMKHFVDQGFTRQESVIICSIAMKSIFGSECVIIDK